MLQIKRYTVISRKVPPHFDGFTILQLTDLHGASFGPGNTRLLEAVRAVKPDLIAATGDMINCEHDGGGVFASLAGSLTRDCPVYYVAGNHEGYIRSKRPADYIRQMQALGRAGVFRLSNAGTFVERGGDRVAVYGLELPPVYYRPFFDRRGVFTLHSYEVARRLGPAPGVFTLLLVHTPVFFDAAAGWGADLTLAGHLHGGMIRLPLVGGVLSPDWTLFPRYDAGQFTIGREGGSSVLIVGRGLGSNRKLRIFNPPEIAVVTLRRP